MLSYFFTWLTVKSLSFRCSPGALWRELCSVSNLVHPLLSLAGGDTSLGTPPSGRCPYWPQLRKGSDNYIYTIVKYLKNSFLYNGIYFVCCAREQDEFGMHPP